MKTLLFIAAILGAIGIAFGAFGAHGLESKISESQIQVWDTAVKYQMIHVILIIALLISPKSNHYIVPCILFLIGILFFSGSLYLLSLKDLLNLGSFSKILGPITPLGGLSFIIGWILLAIKFLK